VNLGHQFVGVRGDDREVGCTPDRVDWDRHPSRRDVPKGDITAIVCSEDRG
jgi:hypothetical protein